MPPEHSVPPLECWRVQLATRLLSVAVFAVGVGFIGAYAAALIRGGDDAPGLAWALLVVPLSAVFMLFSLVWRVHLTATTDGLIVQNMLKRYDVPWAEVKSIDVAFRRVAITTENKVIQAVGTDGMWRNRRASQIRQRLRTIRAEVQR